MRLVKAFVGGVIGAAISAAIIVSFSKYMEVVPPDWLAIVAGVVTGLGVRIMGKSDRPGPSYLSGAIAALLTLVAFYGGTQAATNINIMEAQVDQTQIKLHPDTLPDEMKNPPPVTGSAEDLPVEEDTSVSDDDPATDENATDSPDATPAAEAEEEPSAEVEVVEEEIEETVVPAEASELPPVVKVDRPKPRAEEFNWLSFVFIAVGALIAYEMGRSCGCSKPAA